MALYISLSQRLGEAQLNKLKAHWFERKVIWEAMGKLCWVFDLIILQHCTRAFIPSEQKYNERTSPACVQLEHIAAS